MFPDPCNGGSTNYTDYCTGQSTASILLGLALALGTIGSSIPQITRIVGRKSSVGISGTFLLLANFNQYMVVLNCWMLDFPQLLGAFQSTSCIWDLIPFFQLLGLWSCYYIVWAAYIYYYKQENGKDSHYQYQFMTFVIFSALVIISMVGGTVWTIQVGPCNAPLYNFALSLGVISTIIGVCEWTPQIINTYRLKQQGSLSLIMLGIQMPGCGIIIIYYVFLDPQNWSTTIGYCFTFVQEVILVAFLVYYKLYYKGVVPDPSEVPQFFGGKKDKKEEKAGLLGDEVTSDYNY
ncbi:hypothetical protein KIPB_005758 [Kipferlia bialata]|uniref:Cystinosin/ERS1p repeat n=1 Tax=Kipferlia bialata TaxID=797122 RepID=A0A9K3CXZ9_9EUKA|nr:hypothetical protein KIPB_005758 [Kipferlia bialata]|eukprot:g5758.t1